MDRYWVRGTFDRIEAKDVRPLDVVEVADLIVSEFGLASALVWAQPEILAFTNSAKVSRAYARNLGRQIANRTVRYADRDESESCQRGTPGCSVDHEEGESCQTW